MKKILGLWALIISSYASLACDICGCATSIGGVGYLPSSAFHFVGLSYGYRNYAIQHPILFENDPIVTGSNTMQSIELSGRWQATKRLQLLGFVPYRINVLREDTSTATTTFNGVGDASILLNYNVLNKPNLKGFIGAGVKLPSGKSNQSFDNIVIPNMQIGTSSWDAIFMANFTYLKSKVGVNSESIFKLNSKTNWDYRFGNQLSTSVTTFYRKRVGDYLLLPQISFKLDYQAKSLSSVKYNITDDFSGMNLISLPIGFDVYRKIIGLRLKYEVPVYAQISEGLVQPKANAQCQLIYILNKK